MIPDETKQKLWEEIRKSMESEIRTEMHPGERTKEQLKEFFGVGNGQIKIIIAQLIKEGKIKSRPALHKGKSCTAYSLLLDAIDDVPDQYANNKTKTGNKDQT